MSTQPDALMAWWPPAFRWWARMVTAWADTGIDCYIRAVDVCITNEADIEDLANAATVNIPPQNHPVKLVPGPFTSTIDATVIPASELSITPDVVPAGTTYTNVILRATNVTPQTTVGDFTGDVVDITGTVIVSDVVLAIVGPLI